MRESQGVPSTFIDVMLAVSKSPNYFPLPRLLSAPLGAQGLISGYLDSIGVSGGEPISWNSRVFECEDVKVGWFVNYKALYSLI